MTNLYRFNHENPHFGVLYYNIHTDMGLVGIRYSLKFKLTSTILSTE